MGLTSGTKLGPYEIVSPLGAGGMGEVYRARDTRLDRTVAIKVLNSTVVSSPELKQRFEREARIISQLNHPHICTLHDVGHQDGTDFLVMEYLEGETLAQRLTKGALAVPDLLKISIDILDGLEQAHRAGVVHRDLKPGNVMLTNAGAKLLDFGLAKPTMAGTSASVASAPVFSAAMTLSSPSPQSPLTTSGALVGTVQYMAPEQFQGNSYSAAAGLRISPQGDQLLYVGTEGTRTDTWVAQLSRATRTRISLESQGGAFGTWSPDGRRAAYQNGVGGDSIIVRTSDGLGSEQVIAKMQGTVSPRGWSADGNYIVFEYWATDSHNPGEIWVAPLKRGEAPHALVRNISSFGTDLSPDGKWLAYTSDESGRLEVYVIPFSPVASTANALAAGRWQISFEGGNQPRWSPSGKELFFPNPSGTTLYVTSIKADAGKFESSNPRKLFDIPLHPSWAFYDIGRDGNTYMFRYVGRQGFALTMLLNWRPSGQ